ncbi:MAG: GHKL domain-containing protein [Deltaproteobacteria bacterium]|nr:GHKL domain-containing protein [Deltaproteobacteria bacterium]
MKLNIPVPMERLAFFKKKLGLEDKEVERLNPYRDIFISKKREFSKYFHHYFLEIPQTRIILEHENHQNRLLKDIWPQWFELIFEKELEESLFPYLWRSGLVHVEENIDQRFINLGYSVVRQFCQKVAEKGIPVADLKPVLVIVDKMVDFCLLVETQAYIMATAQCDIEIVKGLSHQVRNPITIIGGNIIRLQRDMEPGSRLYKICEMIMEETKRLDHMLIDTGLYSETFQSEPGCYEIDLEILVSKSLEKLRTIGFPENVKIDIDLDSQFRRVQGDEREFEIMFYNVLENCLEALDPEKPYIRISSRLEAPDSPYIQIEIFNTGVPVNEKDLENLFIPFFSSKPDGTGFGLPIARLVAKKHLGDLYLEPIPNQGTRCVIMVPILRSG